jgi:hypothetical protein
VEGSCDASFSSGLHPIFNFVFDSFLYSVHLDCVVLVVLMSFGSARKTRAG